MADEIENNSEAPGCMRGGPIAGYRRWFEYETDAHAKVFASFDTVPTERRSTTEFRRAVSIMAHVVAARRVWLWRLGVIPGNAVPLFPDDPDIAQVATEWEEVQGLWSNYLSGLDDAALAREFEYQSLDAGRFRNRLEDVLAQLFGHSSYHRGQIAMMIRGAGGEPAATDLIYWCREPVAGGEGK
jgi:uncharacterized damage-inducible protein DinB